MHSIPRVFLAVGECGDGESTLINALRDLNNEIEKGAKLRDLMNALRDLKKEKAPKRLKNGFAKHWKRHQKGPALTTIGLTRKSGNALGRATKHPDYRAECG